MVSHALCAKLAELGGADLFNIVIIGEENRPAYDRVGLSKFFSGTTAAEFELKPSSWYADEGFRLRLGQRVARIDRDNRLVLTDCGEQFAYDRLVIATGSRPFVPPIAGAELPGVFVYRTIEDLEAIRDYSRTVSSAAVMGGGLLGLEAAKALLDLRLKTHVIEMAPSLMPRQLDTDGAGLLQEKVEALGIEVHLLKRTQSISLTHSGSSSPPQHRMQFDSGDPIDVGMVVVSAGIRPRGELAEDCGLEVSQRKGIEVDSQLRTSDDRIYAIGECAEHSGIIYGLVGPGYQMAHVVAENLTGGSSKFTGGDQSAKLKLLGVDVATIGRPVGEVEGLRTVQSLRKDHYRKLLLQSGRVVGAMAVGPWSERDRVQQAIAAGRRIWPWNIARFQRIGNLWPAPISESVASWPDHATVCSCLNVSRGRLTEACRGGCDSVESLAQRTGASTACGSCRPLLAELIGAPLEAIPRDRHGLLIASVCAAMLLSMWVLVGRLGYSQSVVDLWHQVDIIWRDSFWKQVTGYSLTGIAAIGLLLPLRKRIRQFTKGSYATWRTIHAVVGTLTLVGLLVHTGMRMGANLNFLLAAVFLAINLSGIVVGVAASMESKARGDAARRWRTWRPKIARLHLWLFWPLPALLAIHVFCVYFY